MAFYVILLLIFVIAGSIAAFMNLSPQFGASSKGERLTRIHNSKNFKNGQFQNLLPTSLDMSFSETVKVTFDFIKGGKGFVPEDKLPTKSIFGAAINDINEKTAAITWFGHSAVLINVEGKLIFIDPMLGSRASPVTFAGTKRFDEALPIIDSLKRVDAVLLSHDHYDHLDYQSILKLKDKTSQFFVPLGVGAHLKHWGVEQVKITEFDWWEQTSIDGVSFIFAPSRHFSGRGITDRNKTLWGSWVIKHKAASIYFGGDSGYGNHFREIGNRHGPFNLTMLDCGQYNEKWQQIHMLPEEVVKAHEDLKGQLLMPIHWGAFSLALHHWKEPIIRLKAAAKKENMSVATPLIGETWQIGADFPTKSWWEEVE